MAIAVVPFTPDHLEPAAALLAARHRADQGRVDGLPPGFGDPAATGPALEALLQTPSTDGWAALSANRLVGFLVGHRELVADTTLTAVFADTCSVRIPFLGYAAEPDQAEAVYRALYGAAAAPWVAAGFFLHSIRTTADGVGAMPWFALGFGQRVGYGVRPLDDLGQTTDLAALPAPVVLRRAGPADRDATHGVVADTVRFHANAPIFLPQLREAIEGLRDEVGTWLADPAVGYWLAEAEGEAVGVMGLHPADGFIDVGEQREQGAYLFFGYLREAVRGRGLATALLAAALSWAWAVGYTTCAVEWLTANPLSSRFWPQRGFAPVVTRLDRRVDPRVAWAKPTP